MKDTAHARIMRRILKARNSLRGRRFQSRARASVLGAFALFVLGAAVAVGCGWEGTAHSVRFNAWLSEREFSRLPPLPFSAREKMRDAGDYDEEDWEAARKRRKQLAREVDALWRRAEEAAKSGEPRAARDLFGKYLERAGDDGCGDADPYGRGACVPARRRSAADQLDALSALDRGAGAEAVRAYIAARHFYDSWAGSPVASVGGEEKKDEGETAGPSPLSAESSRAGIVRCLLDEVPQRQGLDDNVAYLSAAVLYREEKLAEAAEAFAQLASLHPRSEKREAALYMAGLSSLKQSESYTGEHATAEDPCAECRDDAWRAASGSFRRLLADYPRGPLAAEARGWLGYLHLRVGETAEGLAEYYRLLADERDAGAREEGYLSLRLARGAAEGQDMDRLEAILADEPRAALAYAYHEIYNYGLSAGTYIEIPEERNPYGFYKEREDGDPFKSEYRGKYYEWEEKERERIRREDEKKSLARVASFATRMMRSHARAETGGGFALRVAQVQLELGDAKAARELSRRALASGVSGDERAAALWVEGAAEQRLGDFKASRRALETLVSEFPAGDLTEGARRLLAITAEEGGDLDAALEHYIALDYTTDIAYFVDVLLTPEQLEAFILRRQDARRRDMLYYSLGVRYLRLGRFEEARAAYSRVRPHALGPRFRWYEYDACAGQWPRNARPCFDPKEPESGEPNVVLTRWVMRDLKTMEEIELLQKWVELARDDEEKAEALYQLAGYFYESSELTFYNPAAWRGVRGGSFLYDHEMRAPREAQLMRAYMEEHEPLVRALKVYLEVARRFPRARAARDSLYTAAVIHERLVEFQWYWPEQYSQGLYPGERVVTYADVRREYPLYQLPRGTFGWEPRTRTVNGRAGWDEAPKPKPLTGAERARRKLRRAESVAVKGWSLFGEVAGGRLRRGSLALLSLAGLLTVWRATRRSRALLFRLLARFARRTPKTPDVMPRPTSSFAAHEPYTFRARAGAATRGASQVLWQIVLDRRGRAALALNFLTHGVLTALLWALTWALRSG